MRANLLWVLLVFQFDWVYYPESLVSRGTELQWQNRPAESIKSSKIAIHGIAKKQTKNQKKKKYKLILSNNEKSNCRLTTTTGLFALGATEGSAFCSAGGAAESINGLPTSAFIDDLFLNAMGFPARPVTTGSEWRDEMPSTEAPLATGADWGRRDNDKPSAPPLDACSLSSSGLCRLPISESVPRLLDAVDGTDV